MSTFDAFTPARRAPVTGAFSAILERLVAWNERRVTVKLLTRLTDRELGDIGLTRAQVAGMSYRR